MNWRFFSVSLLLVLAATVNVLLVRTEDIVGVERKKGDTRRGDPLFGMSFTPDQREPNLKKMGFDAPEVQRILALTTTMEKQYHLDDPEQNVVLARIDGTSDQAALATALCGTGSTGMAGATLPVRYEAVKYLVAEDEGARSVVNLNEISGFEYQGWAVKARVDAIYEAAELTEDRRPDATRMALAAVLAGSRGEAEFLERRGGWGGVLWTGWSWERVMEEHPGVRQRVEEYVALMHVAAEQAHLEGGLCRNDGASAPAPGAGGGL